MQLRRRSPSVGPRREYVPPARYDFRDDRVVREEAEYYNRRAQERSFPGEAYHGATRDWAIVDVPPGTERVQMDGIGGASQEVTWQRYNGVRRSKFMPDGGDDFAVVGPQDFGPPDRRRYVGMHDKRENMWTEITKDLVVKEALEQAGYDFEETEYFYYVIAYLRYVSCRIVMFPFMGLLTASQEDVRRLVELSEDIRTARRERIREMEWEERHPAPKMLPPPPGPPPRQDWDEERIVEREVVYDGRPTRRYLK